LTNYVLHQEELTTYDGIQWNYETEESKDSILHWKNITAKCTVKLGQSITK
jgi:hypothetical protein